MIVDSGLAGGGAGELVGELLLEIELFIFLACVVTIRFLVLATAGSTAISVLVVLLLLLDPVRDLAFLNRFFFIVGMYINVYSLPVRVELYRQGTRHAIRQHPCYIFL